MVHVYRKSNLARSMSRMQRIHAEAYDFYPRSWVLPFEHAEVVKWLAVKPSEDAVAQVYITRPLLLDGYKFDLRIYALVTCCDPLRVLIHREGLVRLCTQQYCPPDATNVASTYMHLTNYSLNKHNPDFVQNNLEDEGDSSKRSLSWLWDWMRDREIDPSAVWADISDVVVKTLISIQSTLAQNYRACQTGGSESKTPFNCFELLGFDVLITDSLRAVLIEVNHMPSYRTDSALDKYIKEGLIENTLRLLNVSTEEKERYFARSAALSQMRLYGSLFSDGGGKKKMIAKGESKVRLWEAYLKNERRYIGNFDLIYPANEDASQPTHGMQPLYVELLTASHALHWSQLPASPNSGSGSEKAGFTSGQPVSPRDVTREHEPAPLGITRFTSSSSLSASEPERDTAAPSTESAFADFGDGQDQDQDHENDNLSNKFSEKEAKRKHARYLSNNMAHSAPVAVTRSERVRNESTSQAVSPQEAPPANNLIPESSESAEESSESSVECDSEDEESGSESGVEAVDEPESDPFVVKTWDDSVVAVSDISPSSASIQVQSSTISEELTGFDAFAEAVEVAAKTETLLESLNESLNSNDDDRYDAYSDPAVTAYLSPQYNTVHPNTASPLRVVDKGVKVIYPTPPRRASNGQDGTSSPHRRYHRERFVEEAPSPSNPRVMGDRSASGSPMGSPSRFTLQLPQISQVAPGSPVRTSLEVPTAEQSVSTSGRSPIIRLNAWDDQKARSTLGEGPRTTQYLSGDVGYQPPERHSSPLSSADDGPKALPSNIYTSPKRTEGKNADFPQLSPAPMFKIAVSSDPSTPSIDQAAKIEQLRLQYQQYREHWLASYKGINISSNEG
eukprot:GSChrysophyteH1.ASY1.ANO1.695.1 assembled CDS